MQNTYTTVGNRVYIRIPASNGKRPLPEADLVVDLRNFEKIQEYNGTWSQSIHQHTGSIYIRGNHSRRREGQPVLARFIANPEPSENTRQLDGNPFNCLECNLVNVQRGVRAIEHLTPIGPPPTATAQDPQEEVIPIRGVSFHKTKKKWEAKPTYNGKRISLGYFPEGMLAEANEAITFFREHGPEAYTLKYGTGNVATI